MSKALLEIQNLHVRVEEKEILHGVDLTVGQDETHELMGPNRPTAYRRVRSFLTASTSRSCRSCSA